MNERRRNWHLWLGFLLCLVGFVSYLPLARFPLTRDVPWVSYLFFAAGLFSLGIGLSRAFGRPEQFRGKILAPVLSLLGLLVVGMFCFFIFHAAKQLPRSARSPQVGQRAPDFSLLDANKETVTLAALLTTPLLAGSQKAPKGVLLIFYRGYW